MYYKNIAGSVLKDVKNPYVANVLAFLLIFVVVFLVIKIIQMIVAKVFEWSILKSLDRTLGFIFGMIEGAAVVCLVIFLITVQPFFNPLNILGESFYYGLVSSLFHSTREEIGSHV